MRTTIVLALCLALASAQLNILPLNATQILLNTSQNGQHFGPALPPSGSLSIEFQATICSDLSVLARLALCAPYQVTILGQPSTNFGNEFRIDPGVCQTLTLTMCDNGGLLDCPGYVWISPVSDNVSVNITSAFIDSGVVNAGVLSSQPFSASGTVDDNEPDTYAISGLADLVWWTLDNNQVEVGFDTNPEVCGRTAQISASPQCGLVSTTTHYFVLSAGQLETYNWTLHTLAMSSVAEYNLGDSFIVPANTMIVRKVSWPWYSGAALDTFDSCLRLSFGFTRTSAASVYVAFDEIPAPDNGNSDCGFEWLRSSNGTTLFSGCDVEPWIGQDMYLTFETGAQDSTVSVSYQASRTCSGAQQLLQLGVPSPSVNWNTVGGFTIPESQLTGLTALDFSTTVGAGAGALSIDVYRGGGCGGGQGCGDEGNCQILLCDLDPTGDISVVFTSTSSTGFTYNMTVDAAPVVTTSLSLGSQNLTLPIRGDWAYFTLPSALLGADVIAVTFTIERDALLTESWDYELATDNIPILYACNNAASFTCQQASCAQTLPTCDYLGDLQFAISNQRSLTSTRDFVLTVSLQTVNSISITSFPYSVSLQGDGGVYIFSAPNSLNRVSYWADFTRDIGPSAFSISADRCQSFLPCTTPTCSLPFPVCGSSAVSYWRVQVPQGTNFTLSVRRQNLDLASSPISIANINTILSASDGLIFPSLASCFYVPLVAVTEPTTFSATANASISLSLVDPQSCSVGGGGGGGCSASPARDALVGNYDLRICSCNLAQTSVSISLTSAPTPGPVPPSCTQPAVAAWSFCRGDDKAFSCPSSATFLDSVNVTQLDQQAANLYQTLVSAYGPSCPSFHSLACGYYLKQCGASGLALGVCRQTCLAELQACPALPSSVGDYLCNNNGQISSCNTGSGSGDLPTGSACLLGRDCQSRNCVNGLGQACGGCPSDACYCSPQQVSFCSPVGGACRVNGQDGVCGSDSLCYPTNPPSPAPVPAPTPTSTNPNSGSCTTSSDCESGESCTDGICLSTAPLISLALLLAIFLL